jgi:hypothetical protein
MNAMLMYVFVNLLYGMLLYIHLFFTFEFCVKAVILVLQFFFFFFYFIYVGK